MEPLEATLLQVIADLPIQPEGQHALVQLDDTDPQPYVLYKNDTYTMLMRPHAMFEPGAHDLFEIVLLRAEQVIYHEDVFIEAAGKASIRDVIAEYNAKNLLAA